MRSILFILTMMIATMVAAQPNKQFAAVGEFSSFAVVALDTFRGDIINWSDPLNEGYLPSGISPGFHVIDAAGREYEITVINSTTFSSANVDLIELQDDNAAPTGQGAIYEPYISGMIPPGVSNALGITPALRAKIDIHNASLATGPTTIDKVHFVNENGNDDTGTRGRPDRPYRTPFGAIKNLQNGDVIIVDGGSYTFGSKVSSVADFKYTDADSIDFTITGADTLSIYLKPGVFIREVDDSIGGDFMSSIDPYFQIYGPGARVETYGAMLMGSVGYQSVAEADATTGTRVFKVNLGEYRTRQQRLGTMQNGAMDTIIMDFDRVRFDSASGGHFIGVSLKTRTDDLDRAYFRLSANDWLTNWNFNGAGNAAPFLMSYNRFADVNFYFGNARFLNIQGDQFGGSNIFANLGNLHVEDMNFVFKVKGTFEATNNAPFDYAKRANNTRQGIFGGVVDSAGIPTFMEIDRGPRSGNNRYLIEANEWKGIMALGGEVDVPGDFYTVRINNAIMDKNVPLILLEEPHQFTQMTFDIGEAIGSGEIIRVLADWGDQPTTTISGNFRVTDTSAVFGTNTSGLSNLRLQNVILENDGSNPAIESYAGATTVNVANVYQKSAGGEDADVTPNKFFEYGSSNTWLEDELEAGNSVTINTTPNNPNFVIDTLGNLRMTAEGFFILEKMTGLGQFNIESNDSLIIRALGANGGFLLSSQQWLNILSDSTMTIQNHSIPDDDPDALGETGGRYVWEFDGPGTGRHVSTNPIGYDLSEGTDASITTSDFEDRREIVVYSTLTASATSDGQVLLPTPSAALLGAEVYFFSDDSATGDANDNVFSGGTNDIWSAGTLATTVTVNDGTGGKVICGEYQGGYKWFFFNL